jgi:hypothetical protein
MKFGVSKAHKLYKSMSVLEKTELASMLAADGFYSAPVVFSA